MTKVAVLKQDGSQAAELELNDAVFAIEPNNAVITDAVLMQRASMRQGTHAVKNRSAVSGGGRKPWKQKGTGRARAVQSANHNSVAVVLFLDLHHVHTHTVSTVRHTNWL